MSSKRWISPLFALSLGLVLAWASGGAAAFLPPWTPTRAPLGGLWPPLMAFALGLTLIVVIRGAFDVLWKHIGHKMPRFFNPRIDLGPHRFRINGTDVLIGIGFVLAQYGVLDLYRDFYNPENQAIGHDNYAFLSTGVAAYSGRWDLYMVDKRPLYGFLTAALTPFFGDDIIHSAVGINMATMSLVQLPMFLIGRFWAGRVAGFVACLMYLGCVLFYPYSHEVSSYPLYMLVSTVVVLAVSMALKKGTWRSCLWAGLSMGVLMLTQVKNFTFNIPMVGLLAVGFLIDGQRFVLQRILALVTPMLMALGLLYATPVEFTPLNVLVMHHREEVNYEIPYTWDNTLKADRSNPSPLSPYLPSVLRGGEFEAVSGVMLTPPNSNVISAFPQDGPHPRWEEVPKTTIPPLTERLSHNIKQFATLGPGIGSVFIPLILLGLLFTAIRPTAREARRFGIPRSWWTMGVLVVPLASCFGSLSLKFNLRYVFHAAPTVFVLVGVAAAVLSHLVIRKGGWAWRSLAGLVTIGLGVSLSISLFIRAPLLSSPLNQRLIERAFFRLPPDARQLMGKGYRLVDQYVDQHVDDQTEIYDCTPIALGLYRPNDRRLIRPTNGSDRDKLCKHQLTKPASEKQRVLVVTSIPEFFGPDAVTPVHASAAGWTLLYGYDMHVPREVGAAEDLSQVGSGWIAVFTDKANTAQLGHSMLNGASPTTTAMAADSPTQPNRSAGRPQDGNP